jgi:diketogulonate reductase-like aldo/keto reductase
MRDDSVMGAGTIPTRTLPAGTEMPVLGLGVWQMDDGRETEQAVEWALEDGYRHIDTASMYRNERSVGAAIRASGVPREQVFVTTKLYPSHLNPEAELTKSLERLGFDYVDLYLIHWPVPLLNVRQWRQFEKLQAKGLAREIGVSNFSSSQIDALRKQKLKTPAVNQVHFSPFRFSPELLAYCKEHNIVVTAYSPLEQGTGTTDPTITTIAERLGRTTAQVMLRWALQHETVVIPKSANRDRIRSNAELFDFELDGETMAELDRLNRKG